MAECYGRVGAEEHRLDALRLLVESDRAPDSVRVELARSLARSDKLDQSIAMLLPIVERKPELRLDLVRLLIQKTSRQPRDQRNWQEVGGALLSRLRKLCPEKLRSLCSSASTCCSLKIAWRTLCRSCRRRRRRILETSSIGWLWPG